MSLGTILLIILVIALLGGFSGLGGGPFYGTGYYGGGGLGLILIVVLILFCLASFELPGQCPHSKFLFLSFHRRAKFNYRIFDAEYFATLNSRFGDALATCPVRARCSTVMSFHQKLFN